MFSISERDYIRDRVLQLAASDERVVAGAVVGSLAHDAGDRWSDLDLTFAVVDHLPLLDVLEDWTRNLIEEFPQPEVEQAHPGIVLESLLGLEANLQQLDDRGIALVAFGLKGSLEIRHEPGPEVCVRLGASDDLVELGLGQRQLLRGAHPGRRCRGQSPDQACKALFVESGHRELDGPSA